MAPAVTPVTAYTRARYTRVLARSATRTLLPGGGGAVSRVLARRRGVLLLPMQGRGGTLLRDSQLRCNTRGNARGSSFLTPTCAPAATSASSCCVGGQACIHCGRLQDFLPPATHATPGESCTLVPPHPKARSRLRTGSVCTGSVLV